MYSLSLYLLSSPDLSVEDELFITRVANQGIERTHQLMANDMDMTRYNPHNLFKAIVYLDQFIENEGLANKVK